METWVKVPVDTRYISIGILDGDDVVYVDFNMIFTQAYWGCAVKSSDDEDFGTYIELNKNDTMSFDIDSIPAAVKVYKIQDEFRICIVVP